MSLYYIKTYEHERMLTHTRMDARVWY